MSTLVHLNSFYRPSNFTNPAFYTLTNEQVQTWSQSAKVINTVSGRGGSRAASTQGGSGGSSSAAQSAVSNINQQRTIDVMKIVNVVRLSLPYPRPELFASATYTIVGIRRGFSNRVNFYLDPSLNALALMPAGTVIRLGTIVGISSIVSAQYYVVSAANAPIAPDVIGPETFSILPYAGAPVTVTPTITAVNPRDNENIPISVMNTSTVRDNFHNALEILKLPRLYIRLFSQTYQETQQLNSIEGIYNDVNFVMTRDAVSQTDDEGVPTWIHYTCITPQAMRFKLGDPITFGVYKTDSTSTTGISVLDVYDSTKTPVISDDTQIIADLSITPISRVPENIVGLQ